jgi:hypothetical protein
LCPSGACLYQLFLSYLLTTFNNKNKFNCFELQLLIKTLMNLNRLTSNVQEMSLGAVKFMKRLETIPLEDFCKCLQQLNHTIVTLNYLVLAHRNENFVQSILARDWEMAPELPKFNKSKFQIQTIFLGNLFHFRYFQITAS